VGAKMEEDSIAITYETLYEILRAEKNKEELCELDETFYKNVLDYIKEKSRILQEASAKNDIFSVDEHDTTQLQVQNIKKIIKEIYERREKKIIDIALNKSRTNSDIIDTANLLHPEQKFFETLTDLLDKFRLGILSQILALKQPNLDLECPMKTEELPKEPEPQEPENKENTAEAEQPKPELVSEPQKTESEIKQEPEKNIKKIKIIKPVEQFVGKELEMYGPYNDGDTAELPTEIADILIEKESAVSIE
jgi:DNA replication initiation complex subunit (GINS family)